MSFADSFRAGREAARAARNGVRAPAAPRQRLPRPPAQCGAIGRQRYAECPLEIIADDRAQGFLGWFEFPVRWLLLGAIALVVAAPVIRGLQTSSSSPVYGVHGQIKAAIDGSSHCSSTAWAAASRDDGGEFTAELDSGAGAALWLTRDDARRIGVDVGSLQFNESYRGISGRGWAAEVTIAQFRLGGLALSDVPALVVSESDGVNASLVGLPILQRLNYRVVGNACVLSW